MLDENNDSLATKELAKTIKAIDKGSVHRICSGQVVLTLAIAVKELLENALDAGATNVEIRLKEHGRELIEVIDNGIGVEECNYQGLTLKHHTSKIQEFDDLLSVETFGFRGEALSSLCALSKLTVITKHKSAEYAHKITYDKDGRIIEVKPCARETGTTVILENLFSTLPVRHKEFHRNYKREFTKMCNLMYAYCLISTGSKILCTNTTSKNSKSVIVSTQSTNTIRENISCIFGHSQLQTLLPFEPIDPTPEIIEEYKLKINFENPFEIEGFISNCKTGRSAQDRQFVYVNSRACEIQKLTKLINSCYHQFNNTQYPFVFLNIKVKRNMVDVNVTPDKRKLFLENESILLAVVKSSLMKMFRKDVQIFEVQETGIKRAAEGSVAMRTFLQKRLKINDDKITDLSEASSDDEQVTEFIACSINVTPERGFVVNKKSNEIKKEIEFQACNSHNDFVEKENIKTLKIGQINVKENQKKIELEQQSLDKFVTKTTKDIIEEEKNEIIKDDVTEAGIVPAADKQIPSNEEVKSIEIYHTAKESEVHTAKESEVVVETHTPPTPPTDKIRAIDKPSTQNDDDEEFDFTQIPKRQSTTISITTEEIRNKILNKFNSRNLNESLRLKFNAEITPSANKTAEKELEREITKDKFAKMEIIGQFNLGFIICKLENDLFIVDQHATDEKYNFEILEKTTVLRRQKLVLPQKLQLTTANKAIIIDNMEIFNKNGFWFEMLDTEDGQNVLLTEVPLSKNICFGKDDIDDLLFMLQDNSLNDAGITICRPTRIRTMLASRACRKSVMIGSALSNQDMQRLITHMGEIEHPWNCPHGRPTMRHLVNLSMVKNVKETE